MNYYFLGIGGIGMSALARFFNQRGDKVYGYDATETSLTQQLEHEGMSIHYTDNPALIPSDIDLVVYTPAIPVETAEFQYFQKSAITMRKRSQMLGEITRGKKCIAVAGSHGKTSTSSLIAHILSHTELGCSAFLGGISKNFNSNIVVDNNSQYVVVEADEFDRSFLQLTPYCAVITATDPDHLDIYGTLANMQDAFREFASQVSETLIIKKGLPISASDLSAKVYTYSFDDERSDFYAKNLRLDSDGHYTYNLVRPGGVLENIKVGTLGWVNVENSIAAAAICLCYGVDAQVIRKAIENYRGACRRLDERFNRDGRIYIDDYAHHPAELSTTISSLREIFPGKKITAVFQPHLYTRTRDFAPEFAKALSAVDKVILLDIYPAREEPIPGVTSEIIYRDITAKEKMLIKKEELMDTLAKEDIEVLVSFGAGNIDRFIGPIREMLEKR